MRRLARIIEEILSRKDPQGYYVLVYPASAASRLSDVIRDTDSVEIEEYAGNIIVRTKSRRMAKLIVIEMAKRGYEPLHA
jgi:hypothetical protein